MRIYNLSITKFPSQPKLIPTECIKNDFKRQTGILGALQVSLPELTITLIIFPHSYLTSNDDVVFVKSFPVFISDTSRIALNIARDIV